MESLDTTLLKDRDEGELELDLKTIMDDNGPENSLYYN